jgi:hypothetical protein
VRTQTTRLHLFRAQKFFALLLLLFVTVAIAPATFAQGSATGAITGIVRDPSGAAVPGATVEIVNQTTGVTERTVTTSDSGQFTVSALPVTQYRIVVSAPGFSKAEAPDVKVNVTETTSVNIPLKVGAVTESVTVTGTATTVQLTNPTTGTTLSSETVGQLPLSTRNFLTLLTLSTGANTELFQSDALGRGAVTINVNGQRPTNNNYQLEGINANDINLPTLDNVPLPNPQTVQEFKTQTSLYDASQGRNGGGNIQVALKSGSNSFHGDAFIFLRNNVLNANDFFNNAAGVKRPVNRQGQYGFSIGGPIYFPHFGEGGPTVHSGKNRHFFFFNYQGTNAASGAAAGTNFTTTIPVLPANRSQANLIATFFPGGLPPGVTSLDPVVLRLLNLPGSQCPGFGDAFCIPSVQPITPGGFLGRITRTGLGTYEDDQYVISIDSQLTTNHKLTGRYFNSINALFQPFNGGSTLPYPRTTPGTNRFLKLGLTSVFSSRFVNDFRAGFNRYTFSLVPQEFINAADIGQTRGNTGQFPAISRFSVTGAFSIGAGVNDDRGGAFNTFVLGDDATYTWGNHTIRFGGEGSYYQLNRFNNFATRGSLTFGAGVASDPAGFQNLTAFQNFLLGRITGTQGRAGFSTFYFRATDYAFYAQDDWKFNSRLTLNLGVRYELLSTAHEKFNFLTNLQNFNDGSFVYPIRFIHPSDTPRVGTPGVSNCTLTDCYDKNNFAPRVGFAYDVFGNQRTVLRGGYGIYYQRTSNQPLLQTSGGTPFSQDFSAARFSVTTANPFPNTRPNSDFPLATDQEVPRLVGISASGAPSFALANGTASGPFSGFLFYPSRDFHSPYAQQWNLTAQHEVFKNWVAEIGYVGTRGVSLIGTGRPVNFAQICTQSRPCIIPANIAQGVTIEAGATGVARQSDGSIAVTASTFDNRNLRVDPRFLGIANNRLFGQEQLGQSVYHSLQTSLTHRFTNGLYMQTAYTWAKSIDNSSGSVFQDELNGLLHIGDFTNTRDNRGLSDFDRRHRFVVSYNWEIPVRRLFGIEDKGIGRLVSGWSLNGIFTAQSGVPFAIYDSSACTLQDPECQNGAYKATYIGGNILLPGGTRQRIDEYINLDAFLPGGNCVNSQNQIVPCDNADAQAAALGNLGRNRFRGPFQTNWDQSFVKITRLTESTNIEFRAEFFNILNHPSFQGPAAGGAQFGNYGLVDIAAGPGTSAILATVNRPRTIQFALKLNF